MAAIDLEDDPEAAIAWTCIWAREHGLAPADGSSEPTTESSDARHDEHASSVRPDEGG